MGRLKKKGTSGEVTNYISRKAAIRKLQITLAEFRRLCILKGIYPREPKHRNKVSKHAKSKTFYFVKDINFLLHEPLIAKIREHKALQKKLTRAKHKNEPEIERALRQSLPQMKVDHIIKERYPVFKDALKDMDDALSMVYLYADLERTPKVDNHVILKCRRLALEWSRYVIHTRCLRKVFISVKGIYYQAQVMGQEINWIVPHEFVIGMPETVDYQVMGTFTQFYHSFLGFVHYYLFTKEGLKYPPFIDSQLEGEGHTLGALQIQSLAAPIASSSQQKKSKRIPLSNEKVKQALLAVQKMANGDDNNETTSPDDDKDVEDGEAANPSDAIDVFPEQIEGGEETVEDMVGQLEAQRSLSAFQLLFEGQVFFLSREVPKRALEFVIKAFGGVLSWEGLSSSLLDSTGVGGGQFQERDSRITHQIVDRPQQAHTFVGRAYVQPQWVFDCVNAKRLLPCEPYAVGAVLPPHLSPFARTRDVYVPPEVKAIKEQGLYPAEVAVLPKVPRPANDEDESDEDEEEVEEGEEVPMNDAQPAVPAPVQAEKNKQAGKNKKNKNKATGPKEVTNAFDAEDAVYQTELREELKGTQYEKVFAKGEKAKKDFKKHVNLVKSMAPKTPINENKELATVMMTSKNRRIYDRKMSQKKFKEKKIKKLTNKRAALDRKAPSA